jgi:hypothetical protein
MKTASRLLLLVALALTAIALAAGPASAAATIAEPGDWTATGWLTLSFQGGITIVCTESDLSGTVTNGGALTVESIGFLECTESTPDIDCTPALGVRDLPNTATITHNPAGPHTGDVTWDAAQPGGVLAGFDITCAGGFLTCTASTSSALTAELTNGNPGLLEITNEVLAASGTLCGSSAMLNAAWTIDFTAGGTDTTTTVTA